MKFIYEGVRGTFRVISNKSTRECSPTRGVGHDMRHSDAHVKSVMHNSVFLSVQIMV